ncbi:MAG: alpha/beta hydrolase [Chloroflexi bacterium]|nr:alpha/beta hydrolase [Chloroflexota bacterium]
MKLILIHGSGDTGDTFYYQTRRFQGSEAVTLPGHPLGRPCGSAELYAEWLRGYIHGRAYKDVVLAGHSLGGGIALTYALKYPDEVKAVISLASGPYFHITEEGQAQLRKAAAGDPAAYDQWAENTKNQAQGLPSSMAKRHLEARIRIGPGILHHDLDCCMRYNIADRLSEIRVPVLAVAASEDPYCPPEDSYILARRIPGARAVVVAGPSHWHIIDRPQQVNKAIADFLATLG